MPTDVQSPISRKGGKPGSIRRAESPGARSMPGRGDQSEPQEPLPGQQQHVHVHMEAPEQQEQEPERNDSLGRMRRLADRLLGRERRPASPGSFRNFPTDR